MFIAKKLNQYHVYNDSMLLEYKNGLPTIKYIRQKNNGGTLEEQKIVSEYIRHQIHHPENKLNPQYNDQQLQESISNMRVFIQTRQI